MKLFEKEHPGDSVQVDVKVVKIGANKGYQYTALDDCTRYRVLRLYRRCNQESSRDFFAELRAALPFPIRQLQTDNGPEFSLDFSLSVQAAGIHHRHIRPRRPQQNGKVERSHRVDSEEFWSKHAFAAFTEARPALSSWEAVYNHDRFSMALHGLTPSEKLRPFLGGRLTSGDASNPAIEGQVKTGHRGPVASRDRVEVYRADASWRKSEWTLVRQDRGPHLRTWAW
jgi:transposase InsO family protein